MNKTIAATLCLLAVTLPFSVNANEADNSGTGNSKELQLREALVSMLSLKPEAFHIECPQQTYDITEAGDGTQLRFCLNREDKQKRCEVAIHALGEDTAISFEFSFDEALADSSEWFSFMQIHSFPDAGEEWRCPVTALIKENGSVRLDNRWDTQPLSRTTGYHCAEPGSTIQSRNLFSHQHLKRATWHKLDYQTRFSYQDDGQLQVRLNGEEMADISGANRFNDKRPPFLKLGIYKPTSWTAAQDNICVSYRHLLIK